MPLVTKQTGKPKFRKVRIGLDEIISEPPIPRMFGLDQSEKVMERVLRRHVPKGTRVEYRHSDHVNRCEVFGVMVPTAKRRRICAAGHHGTGY